MLLSLPFPWDKNRNDIVMPKRNLFQTQNNPVKEVSNPKQSSKKSIKKVKTQNQSLGGKINSWPKEAKLGANLDSWHPGICPAVHQTSLNKPGELALGQHGVDEAEPAVVPDVHPGQTRPYLLLGPQHPVELILHQQRQGTSAS